MYMYYVQKVLMSNTVFHLKINVLFTATICIMAQQLLNITTDLVFECDLKTKVQMYMLLKI